MPTKKKAPTPGVQIHIGNMTGIKGNVTVSGGNSDIRENTHIQNTTIVEDTSETAIKALNKAVRAIGKLADASAEQKKELKAEVSDAKKAIGKEKVDESKLAQHFRNIVRMSPDILDVILAGLVNPLTGVAMAVKKIAEKAKESVDVVK